MAQNSLAFKKKSKKTKSRRLPKKLKHIPRATMLHGVTLDYFMPESATTRETQPQQTESYVSRAVDQTPQPADHSSSLTYSLVPQEGSANYPEFTPSWHPAHLNPAASAGTPSASPRALQMPQQQTVRFGLCSGAIHDETAAAHQGSPYVPSVSNGLSQPMAFTTLAPNPALQNAHPNVIYSRPDVPSAYMGHVDIASFNEAARFYGTSDTSPEMHFVPHVELDPEGVVAEEVSWMMLGMFEESSYTYN